jgi:hypothetical protein
MQLAKHETCLSLSQQTAQLVAGHNCLILPKTTVYAWTSFFLNVKQIYDKIAENKSDLENVLTI